MSLALLRESEPEWAHRHRAGWVCILLMCRKLVAWYMRVWLGKVPWSFGGQAPSHMYGLPVLLLAADDHKLVTQRLQPAPSGLGRPQVPHGTRHIPMRTWAASAQAWLRYIHDPDKLLVDKWGLHCDRTFPGGACQHAVLQRLPKLLLQSRPLPALHGHHTARPSRAEGLGADPAPPGQPQQPAGGRCFDQPGLQQQLCAAPG